MNTLSADIDEYRRQLEKGIIKTAYQGLMQYFDSLRLYLKSKHPDYFLSDIHYGLMDYTYFYFFPKSLQRRKLKVVILFSHDTFKLEVLLAGYNREAQAKYWKLFKEKGFNKHHISMNATEADRFLSEVLINQPNFSNENKLTTLIEQKTLLFIDEVEAFLTENL